MPTSKLLINKNNIVDDFRFMNIEDKNNISIDENIYIKNTKDINLFKFELNIENVFKKCKNLNYFKLVSFFLLKNKISDSVIIDKNNNFIIKYETISYSNKFNTKEVLDIITNNIYLMLVDLYNIYMDEIDYIISSYKLFNVYKFINTVIKTNFFKKLDINLFDFLKIINIEEIENLDIKLSIIKTIDINTSKDMNIKISGASDLLDIKKDIVFIINNLDKHFNLIVDFFRENNIYGDNILSIRLIRNIDSTLITIYNYFSINLSVMNLILLVKFSRQKQQILEITRIFKLIKSINYPILKLKCNNLMFKFTDVNNMLENLILIIANIKLKDKQHFFKNIFIYAFRNYLINKITKI